jgi:hypothetical protein
MISNSRIRMRSTLKTPFLQNKLRPSGYDETPFLPNKLRSSGYDENTVFAKQIPGRLATTRRASDRWLAQRCPLYVHAAVLP